MTSLCGHERETLRWVLKKSASSWADEYAKLVRLPLSDSTFEPKRNALSAIHDPAKLAEMLAARGRELGLQTESVHSREAFESAEVTLPTWACTEGAEPRIVTDWVDSFGAFVQVGLTMPHARTLLLQWLQLPDGAREEALKVLRGEP